MQFTSEAVIEDVMERTFNLAVNDESVPGVMWTPGDLSERHPVLLMGHGGSQHKKYPPLVNRAHRYVTEFGFVVVAIDAPGHGERTPSEQAGQFVAELRKKMAEGQPVGEIVADEMARLAVQAVPEWQATLDAVQALDPIGISGPIGYWGVSMGGAIGMFLLAAEPRIAAAVLGLAGLPPNHKALANAAAQITIPVEFVLQWNDELVSRESGIALFDTLGSPEKTLHANSGGHAGIPIWESESWERFFNRHLKTNTAG
jgi:pimeloyl-ACP methyl ester carboxylesterase